VIHSPKRLVNLFPPLEDSENEVRGVIRASYANFGFVPYGHAMMGRLYFDPLLKDGCKKIPTQEFQQKNSTNNSKDDVENHQLIPFMIADRGQCSFVQKVRNMEEAGVAVGIVIDETDEDIDSIVMSDDGTGAGIRIPSMLISKIDG
jgi:hypothetical protein